MADLERVSDLWFKIITAMKKRKPIVERELRLELESVFRDMPPMVAELLRQENNYMIGELDESQHYVAVSPDTRIVCAPFFFGTLVLDFFGLLEIIKFLPFDPSTPADKAPCSPVRNAYLAFGRDEAIVDAYHNLVRVCIRLVKDEDVFTTKALKTGVAIKNCKTCTSKRLKILEILTENTEERNVVGALAYLKYVAHV